jgi:hypothetical protein
VRRGSRCGRGCSTTLLAQLEHQPATRRVSEDLQLVLAFDLPDRVTVVPREDVLEWGPEDELFELALEQTRAEPGIELERIEVSDGEQVIVGANSTNFLPSDAFVELLNELAGAA